MERFEDFAPKGKTQDASARGLAKLVAVARVAFDCVSTISTLNAIRKTKLSRTRFLREMSRKLSRCGCD